MPLTRTALCYINYPIFIPFGGRFLRAIDCPNVLGTPKTPSAASFPHRPG
ncbi:hypothetical protein QUB33_27800 [Microcoleus sp. B3-A4]